MKPNGATNAQVMCCMSILPVSVEVSDIAELEPVIRTDLVAHSIGQARATGNDPGHSSPVTSVTGETEVHDAGGPAV
jgi:hypothetical protein